MNNGEELGHIDKADQQVIKDCQPGNVLSRRSGVNHPRTIGLEQKRAGVAPCPHHHFKAKTDRQLSVNGHEQENSDESTEK